VEELAKVCQNESELIAQGCPQFRSQGEALYWYAENKELEQNAWAKLIQQFLDAQIEEREKRIKDLETIINDLREKTDPYKYIRKEQFLDTLKKGSDKALRSVKDGEAHHD
jgi:predicted Fe-S protein YdhL (DUF1289 family)